MTVFLLDVWEDLRRKRLRPVAIGLLAVVLALPLLPLLPLGPDVEAEPSQAGGGAVSRADDAVLVRLEDERSASSSLNVFEAKNPFKEPALRSSAPSGESTSVARSSDAASAADGGSPGAGSSGAPSTDQGSSGSAPSRSGAGAPSSISPSPRPAGGGAGGDGSGNVGSPGGGGAGDGSREGSRKTEREAETSYTFTIDLRFGPSARVKNLRGLKRLSALPSDRAPVLVFLGVTVTRHSAVFLVDAGVRQQGEGACSPSPGTCTFLFLRLDRDRDSHSIIAADGTTYSLRLLDIERVSTDTQTARPGGSEASAAGRGATRPFVFRAPALVDEQE